MAPPDDGWGSGAAASPEGWARPISPSPEALASLEAALAALAAYESTSSPRASPQPRAAPDVAYSPRPRSPAWRSCDEPMLLVPASPESPSGSPESSPQWRHHPSQPAASPQVSRQSPLSASPAASSAAWLDGSAVQPRRVSTCCEGRTDGAAARKPRTQGAKAAMAQGTPAAAANGLPPEVAGLAPGIGESPPEPAELAPALGDEARGEPPFLTVGREEESLAGAGGGAGARDGAVPRDFRVAWGGPGGGGATQGDGSRVTAGSAAGAAREENAALPVRLLASGGEEAARGDARRRGEAAHAAAAKGEQVERMAAGGAPSTAESEPGVAIAGCAPNRALQLSAAQSERGVAGEARATVGAEAVSRAEAISRGEAISRAAAISRGEATSEGEAISGHGAACRAEAISGAGSASERAGAEAICAAEAVSEAVAVSGADSISRANCPGSDRFLFRAIGDGASPLPALGLAHGQSAPGARRTVGGDAVGGAASGQGAGKADATACVSLTREEAALECGVAICAAAMEADGGAGAVRRASPAREGRSVDGCAAGGMRAAPHAPVWDAHAGAANGHACTAASSFADARAANGSAADASTAGAWTAAVSAAAAPADSSAAPAPAAAASEHASAANASAAVSLSAAQASSTCVGPSRVVLRAGVASTDGHAGMDRFLDTSSAHEDVCRDASKALADVCRDVSPAASQSRVDPCRGHATAAVAAPPPTPVPAPDSMSERGAEGPGRGLARPAQGASKDVVGGAAGAGRRFSVDAAAVQAAGADGIVAAAAPCACGACSAAPVRGACRGCFPPATVAGDAPDAFPGIDAAADFDVSQARSGSSDWGGAAGMAAPAVSTPVAVAAAPALAAPGATANACAPALNGDQAPSAAAAPSDCPNPAAISAPALACPSSATPASPACPNLAIAGAAPPALLSQDAVASAPAGLTPAAPSPSPAPRSPDPAATAVTSCASLAVPPAPACPNPDPASADPPTPACLRVRVGDRVRTAFGDSGVVRFVGLTHFRNGEWVGVELDLPKGKNDGTVLGVSYFGCGSRHGLFTRAANLVLLQNGAGGGEAGEAAGEGQVGEERRAEAPRGCCGVRAGAAGGGDASNGDAMNGPAEAEGAQIEACGSGGSEPFPPSSAAPSLLRRASVSSPDTQSLLPASLASAAAELHHPSRSAHPRAHYSDSPRLKRSSLQAEAYSLWPTHVLPDGWRAVWQAGAGAAGGGGGVGGGASGGGRTGPPPAASCRSLPPGRLPIRVHVTSTPTERKVAADCRRVVALLTAKKVPFDIVDLAADRAGRGGAPVNRAALLGLLRAERLPRVHLGDADDGSAPSLDAAVLQDLEDHGELDAILRPLLAHLGLGGLVRGER